MEKRLRENERVRELVRERCRERMSEREREGDRRTRWFEMVFELYITVTDDSLKLTLVQLSLNS
jgi:hypothetical protein